MERTSKEGGERKSNLTKQVRGRDFAAKIEKVKKGGKWSVIVGRNGSTCLRDPRNQPEGLWSEGEGKTPSREQRNK